ncbi:MAG: ISL3 family transposase [Bacilli bacterium]
MLNKDYITKMLKLQDENLVIFDVCFSVEKQNLLTYIFVKTAIPPKTCVLCESNNIISKGYVIRTIKHNLIVGSFCIIKFHQRRFKCLDCSKSFNEKTKLIEKSKQLSQVQIQAVLQECKNVCSFRSIAKKLNISTTTVIKIFRENVYVPPLPLTEVIGVDDFRGTTGISKYCFIIKDLLGNEIIDILSSRTQKSVEDYLKTVSKEEREQVKYIVMDLWKPYRTIFKFWFPKAKLIADKFHYTRLINDQFNRIRISFMNEVKNKLENESNYDKRNELEIDYYYLKKYWKIIMEYDEHQENKEFYCYKLRKTITKFDVLDRVLNLNPHLAEAYYLRNKFLKVIKTSTYETIESNLKTWINEVCQSDVNEYNIAIRTLLNWKQEMINSFIIHPTTGTPMNNASTEGSNNFCKVIKRVSYGYKDFELMRARILYCNRKTMRFKSKSIKDRLNYEEK